MNRRLLTLVPAGNRIGVRLIPGSAFHGGKEAPVRGQAWLRLFEVPGGSVTLSRRGLGVTGGIGRVRASSRGWSYLRLGKGLYYRRGR